MFKALDWNYFYGNFPIFLWRQSKLNILITFVGILKKLIKE